MVGQSDELPAGAATVADVVVGQTPEHVWASDPRIRAVLVGLLGGVRAEALSRGLSTGLTGLSGGERRRVALARALVNPGEVLLLDEPTNHLDIEAITWLAAFLTGPGAPSAVVVVTHDRWFLDEVCTATWEVADGSVRRYEGGYAAWVLARAERLRQQAVAQGRRRNLLRKELAWLRRGPPARTSKPQFRIDAANELIADVPEPRDTVRLRRMSAARLGKRVVELREVDIAVPAGPAGGQRLLLGGLTWRIGPGDRIGLLGPNGVGKTSLIRVLAGQQPPTAGEVVIGATVRPSVLAQVLAPVDPADRVLASVERLRREFELDGREVPAATLVEEFGFRGEKAITRLGDLSGGELRRLELLKLLLGAPNLLFLDEPTNDLDVDTLAVVEDVLDNWPGTLVVVSHDRYFLERTCDDVYALIGDGKLRHLPRGVAEYLQLRTEWATGVAAAQGAAAGADAPRSGASGAQARAARKELDRIERKLARNEAQAAELHAQMALAHDDHVQLVALAASLRALEAQRDELETEWLERADSQP